MSLASKAQQYDVLVKELFELLDKTEETDDGQVFYPVFIHCSCEMDRMKLEQVLVGLKSTLEDFG